MNRQSGGERLTQRGGGLPLAISAEENAVSEELVLRRQTSVVMFIDSFFLYCLSKLCPLFFHGGHPGWSRIGIQRVRPNDPVCWLLS